LKPLGWGVKKCVEVHEEYEAVDPVFMAISRIEDIQTTSVYTLVGMGVIQLLPPSVGRIRGRVRTGNITWRGVAAHGNIPIHVSVRQRGEGISRLTNGKSGGCNWVLKGKDL
jgi:hypothetical protein